MTKLKVSIADAVKEAATEVIEGAAGAAGAAAEAAASAADAVTGGGGSGGGGSLLTSYKLWIGLAIGAAVIYVLYKKGEKLHAEEIRTAREVGKREGNPSTNVRALAGTGAGASGGGGQPNGRGVPKRT